MKDKAMPIHKFLIRVGFILTVVVLIADVEWPRSFFGYEVYTGFLAMGFTFTMMFVGVIFSMVATRAAYKGREQEGEAERSASDSKESTK